LPLGAAFEERRRCGADFWLNETDFNRTFNNAMRYSANETDLDLVMSERLASGDPAAAATSGE